MKRKTLKTKWKMCMTVTAMAFVAAVLLIPNPAMAAPNQGTGDIGGIDADLANSNIFSLSSTTLGLTKMAFLADGTQLTTNATLPRGTEVRFVIYTDNTTLFPIDDVSIQDVLDSTFAYQAGSMKVDNTIPSLSTEAVIYSTVNAVATTLTDAPGADVGSYDGPTRTIDVGNSVEAGNNQLDLAANRIWAILFRAFMQ